MHQILTSLPMVPPGTRWLFYGMAALALGLFAVGTLDRIWLWTLGRDRPSGLLTNLRLREWLKLAAVKVVSRDCLLARRTFAHSPLRGGMLMGIMWGSLILAAGVAFSFLSYLSPFPLSGYETGHILALLMDVGGGLALAGLVLALARRYFFHPARWISVPGDGFLLVLFTLVVALGFVLEGARLAGTGFEFAAWYPVGAGTGVVLMALWSDRAAWLAAYPMLYLLHAGTGFALVAYMPFSRLFHIFASQITTFAAREELRRFGNLAPRPAPASSRLELEATAITPRDKL